MTPDRPAHVDNPGEVGRRLRDARAHAGLSLRALAYPGCSASYLSKIEHGKRRPSLQVLLELAQRLSVPLEYLAWGDETRVADRTASTASAAELPLLVVDAYRRAAREARTPEQRAWFLAGIAQLAALAGDASLASAALSDALAEVGDASASAAGAPQAA